jgi:hypothetical protein
MRLLLSLSISRTVSKQIPVVAGLLFPPSTDPLLPADTPADFCRFSRQPSLFSRLEQRPPPYQAMELDEADITWARRPGGVLLG